jgi:putative antitoxin of VapBC-like toxin-antitoxin system
MYMRTTLNIDDELIETATRLTGIRRKPRRSMKGCNSSSSERQSVSPLSVAAIRTRRHRPPHFRNAR